MMMYNLQVTQLLLEKAPVFILMLGTDYRVKYINQWGCNLIGYTPEEVLGKDWLQDFAGVENIGEIKSYVDLIFQEQTPIITNFENSIKTRNDGQLFLSWNSDLVRDEDGKVIGLISVGEDVTDKKILLKKLLSQESVKRSQLNRAIEKAKESERDEIASELHDNINQNLTTCKLLLEQELQGSNPLPFASKAFSILQDTIAEIRNLSHRLSSSSVNFTDLELSLKNTLEEIKLATGINTELTISGTDSLSRAPISIIANLFRIIQEQLNNIVKHADARNINISLQADPHSINMEIQDDGKGFDFNSVKKGFGLNNIFRRAEINHGKVYVDTAPGQGCLISIFIPLD